MTTYVCKEFENVNIYGSLNCKTWVVNENLIDKLAITQSQAMEISLAMVLVMITGFVIGEIGHMIKINFERRF